MKKIKLIWDFYGPDAVETAKHHAIHLKEFSEKEEIINYGCDFEALKEYTIAYLIVDENNMILVRDALKPHRGELVG